MTIIVQGIPKPQPRVKAARRGGFVSIYTPGTADAWKAAVRDQARQYSFTKPQRDMEIKVSMFFFMPRPATHFRRRNGIQVLRSDAPAWVTTKPDIDNLAKAVMDALGPGDDWEGLWDDDRRVVQLFAMKLYGESTGAVIKVEQAQLSQIEGLIPRNPDQESQ